MRTEVLPRYPQTFPATPIGVVKYAETLPRFNSKREGMEWIGALGVGSICFVSERPGTKGVVVVVFEGLLFGASLPWGVA